MKTLAQILLVPVLLATASSAYSQALSVGQVLVSNPTVEDSTFAETVLLIVFHDNNIGTAGVFLNRPTWIKVAEAFPELDALAAYTEPLFLGGPAAPTDLWTLLEFDGRPIPGAQPIAGSIYVSLDPEILSDFDLAAESRPSVRVYAGRAEWGPGQLAQEIEDGNWRVASLRLEDVFTDEPETLWQRMPVASQGVTASLN